MKAITLSRRHTSLQFCFTLHHKTSIENLARKSVSRPFFSFFLFYAFAGMFLSVFLERKVFRHGRRKATTAIHSSQWMEYILRHSVSYILSHCLTFFPVLSLSLSFHLPLSPFFLSPSLKPTSFRPPPQPGFSFYPTTQPSLSPLISSPQPVPLHNTHAGEAHKGSSPH